MFVCLYTRRIILSRKDDYTQLSINYTSDDQVHTWGMGITVPTYA